MLDAIHVFSQEKNFISTMMMGLWIFFPSPACLFLDNDYVTSTWSRRLGSDLRLYMSRFHSFCTVTTSWEMSLA